MINFRKLGLSTLLDLNALQKFLTLFQDNVEQAFKQINDEPFIRGKFIDVEVSSAGQKVLNTGLTRKTQGWLTVSQPAPSLTYEVSNDVGQLTLYFSQTGTFKMWVF